MDTSVSKQRPRFVSWGYHDFSLALRRDPAKAGVAEMKLFIGPPGRGPVWGERYPGPGAALDAVSALSWIAANWNRLASPFVEPTEGAGGDCEIDLAEGFSLVGAQPVIWTVRDTEIEVGSAGHGHAFGTESILAVEILSGLASELARGLRETPCAGSEGAVAAWNEAFATTDILPWETEDLEADDDRTQGEWLEGEMHRAAFYCRRLGVDLDRYVRSTVWVVAEQARFALGLRPEGEPDWHDMGWDAPRFADLPTLAEMEATTPQEFRALYAGCIGSAGAELTWDGFVAGSLLQRTGLLRSALYFRRPAAA